ncbi:protein DETOXIFICATION 16-like isoform X2 [Panicum hallii]|uniref:protein DETOXIFICATION 16-like isoform X2 n=1 Tax=Panicum hallii TaxID=206008 RepID=UPI000DF4CC39|nr:protein DETOXIFICATION 16-like isoform X2 [Panicum hallii]
MEEPLLAAATGTGKKIGGGEESLAVREVKKQLYLAGPLVAGFLLQNLVQMVSVMFVGHLGELALASASLATSFAGVTGFSLLAGMACSLDTLCGQAFGARQHHMLGVYKQRAMLVLALVSVPVAAVWAYTGEILAWCGQDPEIAAGAGSYIRWMIPALFVYGALQCHVRFLQTQNLVVPVMLSSGATALCHPAVCWLLVRGLGLGRNGAALANAISYLANLSFLALYVRLSPSCKATWTEFSAEAFRGIPDFLKLAVPSAVMVCMEWWSFELLVLLSGLLPNPKLETAVLSICTRVSNELGAGRPEAARLATRVVVLLALAVGASEGLAMVLVSNLWGYAYSNEEEVVRHTARMMPILAVSLVFDGLQCVLSGVVRGCGRQKAGAFINLAAYYLAGIPSAFVLAFVWHLGGMGLWFGIMCGLVVQMLLLLSITLFTNWNKEALKAKDRVFSSALPADTAAA